MGKTCVAVGAAVWALATVEVHVVNQCGLLCESLVAQWTLVGFAGHPVYSHVPGEVGGVVEMFPTAGASVQEVH